VGKLFWLFKAAIILGLIAVIFGSAGWFAYQLFVKPNQIPPEDALHGQAAAPPDPSLPELEKALALQKQRKLIEARTALEQFMENNPFSSKLKEARTALGIVNADIFFSDIPAPEKIRYVVHSGDALAKIERKLKTTRELLMRCNNLDDPTRLRLGQVLMVNQPDLSVVVDRKAHTLTLVNHGKFFKQYTATSWNVTPPKRGMEKVPVEAKVGEKIAWRDGMRVAFGTKEYAGSERWVDTTVKGYTFYTEGGKKPNFGIGFSPDDMEEISTLLSKNVPVSLQ